MKIIINKHRSVKASRTRRTIRAAREQYKYIKSKSVYDSDGFLTDYTLYSTSDGETYFCMFGDNEVYEPDLDYADWEGDSYEEAMEWFDSYNGFEDELDEDPDDWYNRRNGINGSNVCSAIEEEPYDEWTGEYDQYEEVWDSIKDIDQEFTSENTSINKSRIPAVFNAVTFEPGTLNVDYGGGRFDNAADYLSTMDVVNIVLDPFNRNKKHNREGINLIREHGGADTATCSNVLNVIKEPESRIQVLENIKKLVRPGGTVYIYIHEGNKDDVEGPTRNGYQLNRKTDKYLDEVRQVFPNAQQKGKSQLIIAPNEGAGAGSGDVAASRIRNNDLVVL